MTGLAEYVARMNEGQEAIYYINGPSREAIEGGPYVEAFKKRKLEVIYTLEPIDDFALSHLGEFGGKQLVSADRSDLELPAVPDDAEGEKDEPQAAALPAERLSGLTAWMKEVLGERVKAVQVSKRLEDSPALIVNAGGFMTSSMERVMRAARQDGDFAQFAGKNLEINPRHELIIRLDQLREEDPEFGGSIVEQIHDNALLQAGLPVEPRAMVARSYRILARLVRK
jgi:molecular chaperone HtpG